MINAAEFFSDRDVADFFVDFQDRTAAQPQAGDSDIAKDRVEVYDFASPARAKREQLKAPLEQIHSRFCLALKKSVFRLLNQVPRVSAGQVEFRKLSECESLLAKPASLAYLAMSPVEDGALIAIDSGLAFDVVERFYGGRGQHSFSPYREPSHAEAKILRKLFEVMCRDLDAAWSASAAIAFTLLEAPYDSQRGLTLFEDDYVAVLPVRLGFGNRSGDLSVLVPYAALAGGSLTGRRPLPPRTWREGLESGLFEAKLNLQAMLAETRLPLGALMDLKAGGMIPLALPALLTLKTEGVPLLAARTCAFEGQAALEVAVEAGALTAAACGEEKFTPSKDAAKPFVAGLFAGNNGAIHGGAEPWTESLLLQAAGVSASNLAAIRDVSVTLAVEFGRTQIGIGKLLKLKTGGIIPLDRPASNPFDIRVDGTLFARGEIVAIDQKSGIRLTEIICPPNPLQSPA